MESHSARRDSPAEDGLFEKQKMDNNQYLITLACEYFSRRGAQPLPTCRKTQSGGKGAPCESCSGQISSARDGVNGHLHGSGSVAFPADEQKEPKGPLQELWQAESVAVKIDGHNATEKALNYGGSVTAWRRRQLARRKRTRHLTSVNKHLYKQPFFSLFLCPCESVSLYWRSRQKELAFPPLSELEDGWKLPRLLAMSRSRTLLSRVISQHKATLRAGINHSGNIDCSNHATQGTIRGDEQLTRNQPTDSAGQPRRRCVSS